MGTPREHEISMGITDIRGIFCFEVSTFYFFREQVGEGVEGVVKKDAEGETRLSIT